MVVSIAHYNSEGLEMAWISFREAAEIAVASTKYSGEARYAQAEKSDPFAFNRAVSHRLSGVALAGDYDAELDGVRWHSIKRP